MNYVEFKDYVMTHLWKRGDSIVLDNLDVIVKTAENELNRTLKVEDRTEWAQIMAADNMVQLPVNYREMRAISNPYCEEMKYYIPADFYRMKNAYGSGAFMPEPYCVFNDRVALIGAVSPSNVVALTMMYYTKVPSFQATDESWIADDYFDVYLYCVLKHTAPFLREDERLATWAALYTDAFSSAMSENDDRKYAGSPLKMKFPRGIR